MSIATVDSKHPKYKCWLSEWINYDKEYRAPVSHISLISGCPDSKEEFKLLVGAFLKFENLIK